MKNEFVLFKSGSIITNIPHIHIYSAYDTLYTYAYRDSTIKKLVLDAKNIKYIALRRLAHILHESICMHIQKESPCDLEYPILVLHAPSSSFALAKKQVDHMAIVLNLLSDIQSTYQKQYQGSLFTKTKIDIAPYIFMHSKSPRVSQHHKNRSARLGDMQNRFCFAHHIPYHLLSQYRYIYIVDDVLTTGSTLQALKQMLSTYCAKHNLNPAIYTLAICH